MLSSVFEERGLHGMGPRSPGPPERPPERRWAMVEGSRVPYPYEEDGEEIGDEDEDDVRYYDEDRAAGYASETFSYRRNVPLARSGYETDAPRLLQSASGHEARQPGEPLPPFLDGKRKWCKAAFSKAVRTSTRSRE